MPEEAFSMERIFPGIDYQDEDVLGGIPDGTGGKAVEFFTKLSEQDSEMVQWYATQHIGSSYGLSFYLDGLVRGYCIVDPDRTAKVAIEGVNSELDRLERFAELILDSIDYFPIINLMDHSEKDPYTGESMHITESRWGALGEGGPGGSFAEQQGYIREEFMPVLEAARLFIENPNNNEHYDQEEIIAEYKRELN